MLLSLGLGLLPSSQRTSPWRSRLKSSMDLGCARHRFAPNPH